MRHKKCLIWLCKNIVKKNYRLHKLLTINALIFNNYLLKSIKLPANTYLLHSTIAKLNQVRYEIGLEISKNEIRHRNCCHIQISTFKPKCKNHKIKIHLLNLYHIVGSKLSIEFERIIWNRYWFKKKKKKLLCFGPFVWENLYIACV